MSYCTQIVNDSRIGRYALGTLIEYRNKRNLDVVQCWNLQVFHAQSSVSSKIEA